MIKFISRIKKLYKLSQTAELLQCKIDIIKATHDKFETKINEMSAAYIVNMNDAKSDYLKRYLEVSMSAFATRISLIEQDISSLSEKIKKQ